jgi:L-threonylcarbamoyladenylate synthase
MGRMRTLRVDPERPDEGAIREAAEVIRAGGLVAFPTETVYGLGANALDPAAVRGIFTAKGRPVTNPLIVHVASRDEARGLAREWPAAAERLAAAFWPGPLTLVVPAADAVPEEVRAGGPTVGLRWPAHPVAAALIAASGLPIAAPSANPSTELSPTRPEHVLRGLDGQIDVLLDGGPCPGGIESTVVDVSEDAPRVLRPGLVTAEAIEAVVGTTVREASLNGGTPARSPGMTLRHYAPRTPLLHFDDPDAIAAHAVVQAKRGVRFAWIAFGNDGDTASLAAYVGVPFEALPDDPAAYARKLYALLHELDQKGLDQILIEMPPADGRWTAIRDRLRRAGS